MMTLTLDEIRNVVLVLKTQSSRIYLKAIVLSGLLVKSICEAVSDKRMLRVIFFKNGFLS